MMNIPMWGCSLLILNLTMLPRVILNYSDPKLFLLFGLCYAMDGGYKG